MDRIEERAAEAYRNKCMEIHNLSHSANGELFNPIPTFEDGYIDGATEQKKIDSDEFKKLVVWKLGSAHDAYVRSNSQNESYNMGKFDALDELYKELIRKK